MELQSKPGAPEVRARLERTMRANGILKDAASGLEYFSGYSYQTLYDWDQYFDGIIQLYVGWDTQYLRNGLMIFLANQREDGFIYRSVPRITDPDSGQGDEHVKPFLAQIALLIFRRDGTLGWLDEDAYARLKKYLLYWLNDKSVNGLSVWDSAPHTGMDNQHERAGYWYDCFCEGVDLNSFLVRELRAMALLARRMGKPDDVKFFTGAADTLAQAVQTLWDEQDGIFYDRDARSGKALRVKYIGAFATMWAGIATKAQAERMVREHIMNPDEFWRPFPLPAYSATEPGYGERYLPGDLGCNWRAYTWIPTNYYVFQGLRGYGYDAEARALADITRDVVTRVGDREYYTAESVAGAGLDPFWGWSLLAHFMPWEMESGVNPTLLTLDCI